ncbi:CACNA1B [Symbiodinium pilosum]|uniref:CACNA1B protein n=1 Tax=Symbiodinium pilosum TaxID=2952 RepID=A0A812XET8_SYMPI|nr:CACNA1B [Symbiodinium pilosum]
MQQKQLTRSESTVEQWDSWPTLSDEADESHAKSSFERWVKSWKFERIFAIVLMSNAIFLGIQTQWSSMHLHDELPVAFLVLQMIYAALFILEICFRLAAWGLKGFFCSDDWLWHMLDVFVWLTAVLELVADIMSLEAQHATSSSGFRLLRIVKIARFARAIRIFKVLRFVRALRILLFSILHTLKSLIWSQVLLMIIIFSFAILFSDATIAYVVDNDLAQSFDSTTLFKYFGSPLRTMTTLFRSISGGVTWEEPANALQDVGGEWVLLFTVYVAFCLFAVLNVMVGVFCHSAITGAEKDQDLLVQSLLQEKEGFRERFLQLFKQIDDGSGRITLLEFENRFQDESVKALFEALELGATDAWTLFQMLDKDGDHNIDADEFIDSCIRMRGSARSVDVCGLRLQTAKIRSQLSELTRASEQMQGVIVELARSCQGRRMI